ncbi:hypothetical protein TNCV_1711851 [Trichonephila clavipes]|nr:hypothetical protein TNCV_1711851 [Trichonephila clavipes]
MTCYGTIYISAEISQQTVKRITSADKTSIDWTSVGRFATIGIGGIAPVLYTCCGILEKENFQMAFLEKAKKQDLVLLAEELGQKVSDKMTNIELRNIIIGSKDYEEEFVRDQLSVILEERFERESEEKIARQLAIEEEKSPGSTQSSSCAGNQN